MTATIALSAFQLARPLTSAFVRKGSSSAVAHEFAAPTRSEIPESATLEVTDSSQMVVSFGYSDLEQPEGSDRSAAENGTVVARLAAQTKKILRLQFGGGLMPHLQSRFAFDAGVLLSSGPALSGRALKSFERNAWVVREFLKSMPPDVYAHLKELAPAGPDQPSGTRKAE